MKLAELIAKLQIRTLAADPETEISGISYDSRNTKPGDLFVAVRGFASDGHKFIPVARKNGAAVILCEEASTEDIPYVQVADSRLALALVSCTWFGDPAASMKLIGYTGTNGKTTSTYLTKHILETLPGVKVGLIGTNGNMIGDKFLHSERTTPESYELQELLANMRDAGCTHVVMEVSSHALVLHRVAGIHYAVGAFTNLTQDHLDFHNTMEEYAAAKRVLFQMCDRGVLNVDDPWATVMAEGAACPLFTYSAHQAADLQAKDIELTAAGVRFTAVTNTQTENASLAIPGMFSVYNALGVLAVVLQLDVPLQACVAALSTAQGVKGRAESVPTDGDYAVIIDYSHTPDSLENILNTMRPITRGKLTVLFGCGGDRDRAKRPIMGEIADRLADFTIVTSDNPRTEDPMAIIEDILPGMPGGPEKRAVICDRVEAIHWAIDHAGPGDIIVLAGKGHEDYQEINHVKYPMDERVIVAEYLKTRNKT